MAETMSLDEKYVFEAADMAETPVPLHSIAPGVVHDAGDLCDSDCQDCD